MNKKQQSSTVTDSESYFVSCTKYKYSNWFRCYGENASASFTSCLSGLNSLKPLNNTDAWLYTMCDVVGSLQLCVYTASNEWRCERDKSMWRMNGLVTKTPKHEQIGHRMPSLSYAWSALDSDWERSQVEIQTNTIRVYLYSINSIQ